MFPRPFAKRRRLKNYNYSSAGAYHLTICSYNNEWIFSKIDADSYRSSLTEIGMIIDNAIKHLSSRPNQKVDKYIIMPNHVHILLVLDDIKSDRKPQNSRVSTFVQVLKRYTSKMSGRQIWQKSFHDRIIRNEKEYFETWQYIDENPRKWVIDESTRHLYWR